MAGITHALVRDPEQSEMDPSERGMLLQTEWPIKVRCKVHAANKGIEWCIKRLDVDDTKDGAHIASKVF